MIEGLLLALELELELGLEEVGLGPPHTHATRKSRGFKYTMPPTLGANRATPPTLGCTAKGGMEGRGDAKGGESHTVMG